VSDFVLAFEEAGLPAASQMAREACKCSPRSYWEEDRGAACTCWAL